MVDAWAIDSNAGSPSYSGYDLRMGTVAPFVVGGTTATSTRTGVRLSGSGTDLLVAAQGSPNMSVLVNPGVIVVQGTYTASQGPYTWALDAQTTLTITASHATLDRTDLVVVRIRDGNVDSSSGYDGAVIVITGTPGAGTPSLPTDATYVTIAQISVPHASTSVTSGQITDKRTFIAAPGGELPVLTTLPTASQCPPYQRAVDINTGLTYRNSGTKWLRERVTLLQTSDQSNATTTAVNSSYLYFAGAANCTYQYTVSAIFTCNTTPKFNLLQYFPSGARIDFGRHMRGSDGNFYNDAVANQTVSPHGSTSVGATSTYGTILITGQIAFGATAGNYQVAFAQFVSDATAVFLMRGSYLTYQQMV